MRPQTLPPDNKEDQDNARNPSQVDYDEKFNDIVGGYSSTSDELKELEKYVNNPNDSTPNSHNSQQTGDTTDLTASISEVKDRESANTENWKTSYTGRATKKQPLTIKDWKKISPMAAITGLITGGGLLSLLFSAPSFAVLSMKEAVFGDLNDQLAAMDIQFDHVLKAQLEGTKAKVGICSNVVSIRCKFATMSNPQIKNFELAGFTVESEPKKLGNRSSITRIIAPDGTVIANPNDLDNYRKRPDGSGRAALIKAFSPRLAGTSDSRASNVIQEKFHSHKGPKIPEEGTDEDRAKALDKAVSGLAADTDVKAYQVEKSEDGRERKYILAPDNTKVYEDTDPERFKSLVEAADARIKNIQDLAANASVDSKAVTSFFSGLGKGLSFTNFAESACSVYNTARAVSAMAKVLRLIAVAQFFLAVGGDGADAIKAGDATMAAVNFVGTMAMSADTNKMIINESSIKGTNADGSLRYEEVPNDAYGKTALDADWIKTAMYGEVHKPTARAQQFMIGGGLVGTMDTVIVTIENLLGGRQGIRSTCGVIQSWWVRGAGLIAGIIMAAGSFGVSTALSIGASMAIGFAMPFLEAQLADIAKGTVVSSKTKGFDMGNAFFAGGGALLSTLASARGGRPGNVKQIEEYALVASQVKDELIAAETYNARQTPFDISNQYSFLGSFLRRIAPTMAKSSANISSAVVNIPSLFGTALNSLTPTTHAQQVFKPERYQQCQDVGYTDIGIDADVACNPRIIMTPNQLAIKPDDAFLWMKQNGHITDEGVAQSSTYKDWLQYCTDQRQAGWGETENDDQVSDLEIGKACVDPALETQNDYFGAYYGLSGMSNSIEEDFSTQDSSKASDTNGQVVSPVAAPITITSGYGPRSAPSGGATSWHAAVDVVSPNKDVVAAMAGEVIFIEGTNANVVSIKHADGLVTRYLHMYPKDVVVKVGDKVSAGQKIGRIGCAGAPALCTGDHLDFNIWIDGVVDKAKYSKYKVAPPQAGNSAGKAINPANFLADNGVDGYKGAVNDL